MSIQSNTLDGVDFKHAFNCCACNDNVKQASAGEEYKAVRNHDRLEFWESEHTRPAYSGVSTETNRNLNAALDGYLGPCMEHPFLPATKVRDRQFSRVKELVELAYRDIAVYREKYRAAGFSPADLRSWADIQNIPVITKSELIAAFPDRCLNPRYRREDLFPTRSSGSSGQTLLIRVDADAIVTDTIQGVRQFALQSGLRYGPDDLLAHVYTVPWWFASIGSSYHTAFISNLIPPARVAQHLGELAPRIVSCYPSNLEALMPHCEAFKSSLRLAVTHSEHSSRSARESWAARLGVPVLDEYSSEEATRIALELPCGHYHICEDTVYVDVLDPVTFQPQVPGQSGLAVITNLLNEAMPFIRYLQGDYVTQPENPTPCAVRWSQLASIDGRANDAFLNEHGRTVPAGSILDITYRWMFDSDVHLQQFELIQKRADFIHARFVPGRGVTEQHVSNSVQHLEELLGLCLEHPVRVKAEVVAGFPSKTVKRRPIRREIAA
jgi:phenylacetate-CoA ligase